MILLAWTLRAKKEGLEVASLVTARLTGKLDLLIEYSTVLVSLASTITPSLSHPSDLSWCFLKKMRS